MPIDPTEPAQPRILLLDDDLFMLDLQSCMLRSMGYRQVSTVAGAQAALDLLRDSTQPIDVIVCDLNMPGMDGIEFLQALDGGSYCGNVILLSGEGARIMHKVQRLLDGKRVTI